MRRRRHGSPGDINPPVDVRRSICTSVNLHSLLTVFPLFSSSSPRSDYPPSPLPHSLSAAVHRPHHGPAAPAAAHQPAAAGAQADGRERRRAATAADPGSGRCHESGEWRQQPQGVFLIDTLLAFIEAEGFNSVLNISKCYPTLFSHLQNVM